MRNGLRKVLPVFILMILCMIMPATAGCEGEPAAQISEKVIAGFEPLGDEGVITVQYKLALVTKILNIHRGLFIIK